jgi:hypothetical protein
MALSDRAVPGSHPRLKVTAVRNRLATTTGYSDNIIVMNRYSQ